VNPAAPLRVGAPPRGGSPTWRKTPGTPRRWCSRRILDQTRSGGEILGRVFHAIFGAAFAPIIVRSTLKARCWTSKRNISIESSSSKATPNSSGIPICTTTVAMESDPLKPNASAARVLGLAHQLAPGVNAEAFANASVVTIKGSLVAGWLRRLPWAIGQPRNPSNIATRSSPFPNENCIDIPRHYEFVICVASQLLQNSNISWRALHCCGNLLKA
jgi:hypothetical protein